ncbi:MAG TPA: AAA family ATPase, partial [Thermoleophilaceae bacterium]|nr:AAA family ATPase [Thermoleophilaceae bacterium]
MTDLVGSTGLASRLGPAAADHLRREHFAVLREAVTAANGKEIKNTGDGLMVVFRAAADAVGCAVAIQQRMERRNRSADEWLALRIGVALGDATCEEGDYFGMPVVEAARLCSEAAGGQILVTELVRMIGGRDGHVFNSVGALELRGLPAPVPAHEVAWESAGAWNGAIPLPPRLRGAPPVGYVGRTEERERVRRRWSTARKGIRQALLVSGEPGIGKTRFTADAALDFYGEGAVVLFGHCPQELGAPYGGWIQALGHFVEHAPEAVLAAHVDRHGGELARLVPALTRRQPDAPPPTQTDPETERYLLFAAVLGLLELASEESPVVLVLDDLQWADRPTLALLAHAVAETHGSRLLLLATYRDTDLSRDHPLTDTLADLRRERGVERLALRGLEVRDVAAIMEAAAGHEMDETALALAREITAETGGNPFFVGEILRHLTESGALVRTEGGRWELKQDPARLGLPQSVREVIGRRVERLGESCLAVLSSAAVIGREFDLDLLARVVPQSEDELIDLLDRAVAASLLLERAERVGAFAFAHNLINHTLYDDLGATRRMRVHRKIAEALEDLCGEEPGARLAELARHWTVATSPVDSAKAVAYSRQAGERALAELAPDEALSWFTNALELLDTSIAPEAVDRCELTILLGEAQRQEGRPEFRETLLGAARMAAEIGDADRAARAALANNRGFASAFGEVDQDRLATLERALELNRDREPARRARLLALQAMELQFDRDHERRRAIAEEAHALAREAGDARVLPYVLRDYFHATWSA